MPRLAPKPGARGEAEALASSWEGLCPRRAASDPQDYLSALIKAVMTSTHLPWGPQPHTLPSGQGLHFSSARGLQSPAQLCLRCFSLQPHLPGGPWTCVSSPVPGTISRSSCLDSVGGPRTWFVTSFRLGVSVGPTTSAGPVRPARALRDSAQDGEGHCCGSGHPQLIFTSSGSPAPLLPGAVAELLPRELAAAGLQREESHQAKAKTHLRGQGRSKHMFLGQEGGARKSSFLFPRPLADRAAEGQS